MVRYDSIAREFRESRPLNELVNVHCAVDDHTFLTKGGQLFTVLRVKGVDHECLDHPELDNVARRFEAALRSLPGSFRLYQLMLKRDHAPLPHQEYQDLTIQRVIRNRVEYLSVEGRVRFTVWTFSWSSFTRPKASAKPICPNAFLPTRFGIPARRSRHGFRKAERLR